MAEHTFYGLKLWVFIIPNGMLARNSNGARLMKRKFKKKMTTTINNRINTWIPDHDEVLSWNSEQRKSGNQSNVLWFITFTQQRFKCNCALTSGKRFLCYWFDAINTPSRWLHPVVIRHGWHGLGCIVLVKVRCFCDRTRTTSHLFGDKHNEKAIPKPSNSSLENVITHRQHTWHFWSIVSQFIRVRTVGSDTDERVIFIGWVFHFVSTWKFIYCVCLNFNDCSFCSQTKCFITHLHG